MGPLDVGGSGEERGGPPSPSYGPYAQSPPSRLLSVVRLREAFEETVRRVSSTGYSLTKEERDAVHEVGAEARRYGAYRGLVSCGTAFVVLTVLRRGRVHASTAFLSLFAAVVGGRVGMEHAHAKGMDTLAALPRASVLGGEVRAVIAEYELARVAERMVALRRGGQEGVRGGQGDSPEYHPSYSPQMRASLSRCREVLESGAPRLLRTRESKDSIKQHLESMGLGWMMHDMEGGGALMDEDVGASGVSGAPMHAERFIDGASEIRKECDEKEEFLVDPISAYGDPGGVPQNIRPEKRMSHSGRRQRERALRAERIQRAREAIRSGVPYEKIIA